MTKPKEEYPKEIKQVLVEIGKRVRQKRKSVEKNYETFANTHDINKVTLSKLERGENFRMSTLIQVLKALDITIDDFFGEDIL